MDQIKICQNCQESFHIESVDYSFYERINMPPPTFCFSCRLQRKNAYINERTLYKTTCEHCGKSIITMYNPIYSYKVWCSKCYFSDDRDSMQYGVDYDFSRDFFTQFHELSKKVPQLHLVHKNNNAEGCEYSNYVYRSRNAYLCFTIVRSEDIYYSRAVFAGNSICLDSMNIVDNKMGYELVDCAGNYNSRFLVQCDLCIDSACLFNCKNCTNCFMSSNLRNKSYVFRGEQLSRDVYLKRIEAEKLTHHSTQEVLNQEFYSLSKNTVCRFATMKNVDNCTGNFITNSKNSKNCFGLIDAEDVGYVVFNTNKMKDCYDLFHCGRMTFGYEIANAGADDDHTSFALDVGSSVNATYVMKCNNCKEVFGCIGLKDKEYCIFNKQYTKDEYFTLKNAIINQMNNAPYIDKKGRVYRYGEFFPAEFSFFAYNESLAYEEFPKTKEEAVGEGYQWLSQEEKHYSTNIESSDLPDSIRDVDDTVLTRIIACPNRGDIKTKCSGAYRIMPDELRYYRMMNIPLPRFCPNCRYFTRRKWKLPWKLWSRACMCNEKSHSHLDGRCDVNFQTPYSPDRSELVYCEKCYQQEVI
jgi:hypothetical protein